MTQEIIGVRETSVASTNNPLSTKKRKDFNYWKIKNLYMATQTKLINT